MSWIVDLYNTYESCKDDELLQTVHKLAPPFHVVQQAHIEVAIDIAGAFRRADAIEPEYTIIPATEKSATARTSAVVPHALCDHLKYCASDYKVKNRMGVPENRYFDAFIEQLEAWCQSKFTHRKAEAICKYLMKGRLLQDLVKEKVVFLNPDGTLKDRLVKDEVKVGLFKSLNAEKGKYKIQNALIRWRVEKTKSPCSEVWRDKSLQSSWSNYCTATAPSRESRCHVTGETSKVATKHPGGVRGGKDRAKLISNKDEDSSDFVYLGRFTTATQAASVSRDVSFKAHSCLEWLIQRQGFKTQEYCLVAWTIAGKTIPDPIEGTSHLFGSCPESIDVPEGNAGDLGQTFSTALGSAIKSYKRALKPNDDVVLLGIDAATDGRSAITIYHKISSVDFLDRIARWHEQTSWPLNLSGYSGKANDRMKFTGAPSLLHIAKSSLGKAGQSKTGKKMLKNVIARLVPCVVEGPDVKPIPIDIVTSIVNRAKNRQAFKRNVKKSEENAWEECLSVACAVFRSYSMSHQKEYSMSLEVSNRSRDYLYGRLLAVADSIESFALDFKKIKRDTAASRYMQRFSDRPFSTWPVIYSHLMPYISQLRSASEPKANRFLVNREKALDEIMDLFDSADFSSDAKLSGEYLLSFHCQRRELFNRSTKNQDEN